MRIDYNGYPVYKGLQRPMELFGIRGKFIYILAGLFFGCFIFYMLASNLFGQLIGGGITIVLILVSTVMVYMRQKKGLHKKKIDKGIFIYRNLFIRTDER